MLCSHVKRSTSGQLDARIDHTFTSACELASTDDWHTGRFIHVLHYHSRKNHTLTNDPVEVDFEYFSLCLYSIDFVYISFYFIFLAF